MGIVETIILVVLLFVFLEEYGKIILDDFQWVFPKKRKGG